MLDRLRDAATWSLLDEEVTQSLREQLRAQARIEEVVLRLVVEADRRDLASDSAATSTAAWLRSQLPLTSREAHRTVRLATSLEGEVHAATREALADGAVTTEQARAVVRAVDALPDEIAVEERRLAEKHLLTEAAQHDEKALAPARAAPARGGRARGRGGSPRGAAGAAGTRGGEEAVVRDDDAGDGTYRGRFTISTLHGAMLQTALQAILNPQRPDAVEREQQAVSSCADDAEPLRRPSPELMGEAFESFIERMPADRLPRTGGVNATVLVTMDLAVLEGRMRVAEILDTQQLVSPAAARRLACAAGVLPAVLDGRGHVLDLGRKVRLHTPAQRHAMAVQQDGTCAVIGCDRPTTWCDAHHLVPWARGGRTSIKDGVLICPRHHTLAHDPRFHLSRQPDGSLRFHRRT